MLVLEDKKEIDILLRQLLNIGEALYCSGAEIGRIEDSLHRLGKAYGAEHINVYAITSSIVVTAEFSGDYSLTQSRRITKRESMDLSKLERLNQLCRECTTKPLAPQDLQKKVLDILKENPKPMRIYIGQILAAAAFAVFFGGNGYDALAAAAGGLLICLLQKFLKPLCKGYLFFNVLTSMLTSLLICVLCGFFPVLHSDKIMIGDIMVLIPGIAITNSIRYTLNGDSISSMEKLIDSLIQAGGIAVGFTLVLFFMESNISVGAGAAVYNEYTTAIQLISATMGTFAFCQIFNEDKRNVLVPTIGGGLCWGVFLILKAFGFSVFPATIIAAAFIGIYGEIFAHALKVPTTAYFIPACVPLIPGSNLYYSAMALFTNDWVSFRTNMTLLALYAFGIAAGLALTLEVEHVRETLCKRKKK